MKKLILPIICFLFILPFATANHLIIVDVNITFPSNETVISESPIFILGDGSNNASSGLSGVSLYVNNTINISGAEPNQDNSFNLTLHIGNGTYEIIVEMSTAHDTKNSSPVVFQLGGVFPEILPEITTDELPLQNVVEIAAMVALLLLILGLLGFKFKRNK